MDLVRLSEQPATPVSYVNLWQSSAWAEFQRRLGREPRWYALTEGQETVATALVIIDRTWGGYATWDVPQGPLLATKATQAEAIGFLIALAEEAKADRALALLWSGADGRLEHVPGSAPSKRHEHPESTIQLDLSLSDEHLLAQMHPKGRYNIRLAQKHGVTVEQSADVGAYARLAAETAGRDGFSSRSERHYEHFLRAIPGSFLLLGYAPGVDGPICGLIGVAHGEVGIYYYGASSSAHRSLMAPYLLQWEAMTLCRRLGCVRYDLLGIAPADAPKGHPWAKLTEFKRKFGGTVLDLPPERQMNLRPMHSAVLQLKRKLLG